MDPVMAFARILSQVSEDSELTVAIKLLYLVYFSQPE